MQFHFSMLSTIDKNILVWNLSNVMNVKSAQWTLMAWCVKTLASETTLLSTHPWEFITQHLVICPRIVFMGFEYCILCLVFIKPCWKKWNLLSYAWMNESLKNFYMQKSIPLIIITSVMVYHVIVMRLLCKLCLHAIDEMLCVIFLTILNF